MIAQEGKDKIRIKDKTEKVDKSEKLDKQTKPKVDNADASSVSGNQNTVDKGKPTSTDTDLKVKKDEKEYPRDEKPPKDDDESGTVSKGKPLTSKGDKLGRDYSKERVREVKVKKEEKEKALGLSVSDGEKRLSIARERIAAAKKRADTDYENGTITKEEHEKRMAKIKQIEAKADELEKSLKKGKSISSSAKN